MFHDRDGRVVQNILPNHADGCLAELTARVGQPILARVHISCGDITLFEGVITIKLTGKNARMKLVCDEVSPIITTTPIGQPSLLEGAYLRARVAS